jgi:PAS domain S-box-containing protein
VASDLRKLRARSFAAWRWVIRDAPRQAYLAITSLLILGALVIGGVIFFSASGQDNIARQKSTDLARAVIEARQRDLAKTNHDYAWWADAVQNLVDKPDAGWAGDNIGQPLFDTFGITSAFVYDASNRVVFAFQNGAPVKIDPMGEAKASLDKLLAAARANPGEESVAQTGILMFGDQPQLASAAMISYTEYRARWQSGQVPYVLVFLRALDPDYLKGIATDYGLTGLGWAASTNDPDLALLGLTSVDGTPHGQLYWMPERPGRALALHILPWAAAAFALMVVLSLVILLHLGSIQRSLTLSNQEMRKREAELQESRTRLADAARRAKLVYWRHEVAHGGGKQTYSWAQAADLIFGLPATALPKNDEEFMRLVHPEDRDRVARVFADVDVTPQSFDLEYRLRRPNGDYGWVREIGEIEQHEGDRPISYAGTLQDISNLKAAAAALEESERRFRSLADTVPVLVWLRNEAGEYFFFNKTYLDFTGRSLEEEIKADYAANIHPDDLEMWKGKIQAELGTPSREPGSMEYRLRSAGGVYHWFLDLWRPRYDPSGRYLGDIGVLVDVTERKQMEDELRQSQKLQSIGTLAGGIAHDLNNLLVPILGLTELTMEDMDKSNRHYRNLGNVIAAAERARRLVEQILAFSRRDTPSRRPVRLGDIIPEVMPLLRSGVSSSVAIREQLDPATPAILADATQIHQVMMNLASNAADAMGIKGGSITIQVSPVMLDAAFCQLHADMKPGPAACLRISDTGKGMDKETLKRIFEPFFTTKGVGEGTGLGLAVVHGVVTAHGGAVTVESALGRGTVITIYFPAAPAESLAAASDHQAAMAMPMVSL